MIALKEFWNVKRICNLMKRILPRQLTQLTQLQLGGNIIAGCIDSLTQLVGRFSAGKLRKEKLTIN